VYTVYTFAVLYPAPANAETGARAARRDGHGRRHDHRRGFTKDIDLLVDDAPDNIARIMNVAKTSSF